MPDMDTQSAHAALFSLSLAYYGFRRKSLSRSGALAAVVVGFVNMWAAYHFAVLIIVFFLTSSRATKFKAHRKRKLEAEFKEGGQRDIYQVLSNSLSATVWSILARQSHSLLEFTYDNQYTLFYQAAVLGFYCCCSGDTLSSELGILSQSDPVLITTMSIVPRGTNGGVTALGLGAGLLGGLILGVSWLAMSSGDWRWLVLGTFAGLLGSLIDSVIGASLQYSAWCPVTQKVHNYPHCNECKQICGRAILSNNQVNLISATLTGLICGKLAMMACYR